MNGITVRLMHTRPAIMAGWRKAGRGLYIHDSGRRVRRIESARWEVCGGPDDGTCYLTMHVAMHNACREATA